MWCIDLSLIEEQMAEMVRKQVYIQKRQEHFLKRLSKAQGISEAEVIRRAIERENTGEKRDLPAPDHTAWEDILRFVGSRKSLRTEKSPYRWNRGDVYGDREKRFTDPVKD
jgi:hypothetical protein